MHLRKSFCFAIIASLLTFTSFTNAQEQGAIGTWKTEPGDTGGYLNVEIKPCDDAALLCGYIVAAFSKDNEQRDDYEHIGKKMIWGMKSKSATSWKSGKIWAPDVDKTYRSKMKLEGETLVVKGCVAGGLICRAQSWSKI